MNLVLRECAATYKTKKFAIVQNDWTTLRLDAAGNEKAAVIMRNMPMRSALYCIATVYAKNIRLPLVAPQSPRYDATISLDNVQAAKLVAAPSNRNPYRKIETEAG
jgi:hypothetical protein